MNFNLEKLLIDVFDPQPGEVVLVACDVPTDAASDDASWQERRLMAAEWRSAFARIGRERSFVTAPLLRFAATGGNGRELPSKGEVEGASVDLQKFMLDCTLAVFLTQYSATAALTRLCSLKADFRAASLPGLERRMEQSGLSADYREVARRCHIIDKLLRGATELHVVFSTGHECSFDLRYRTAEAEDGFLPRDKSGDRIINLPSGETFVVPYEGERTGEPSRTRGSIAAQIDGEIVVFEVESNRIVSVHGSSNEAARLRKLFADEPACANVAEVAFGCNEWAKVTGNVLEDEKAGFHWAYGRSEHLGGTVGPSSFQSPDNVVHQDIVYARGNPIQIARATIRADRETDVIVDGEYVVF